MPSNNATASVMTVIPPLMRKVMEGEDIAEALSNGPLFSSAGEDDGGSLGVPPPDATMSYRHSRWSRLKQVKIELSFAMKKVYLANYQDRCLGIFSAIATPWFRQLARRFETNEWMPAAALAWRSNR